MDPELVEAETIAKVLLTDQEPEPKETPKDKYLLCHILFFLLGIVHILPMTFFSAANNFWLNKFRNTSDPTNSDDNRTELQSYFAAAKSVVNTIPWVVLGLWNILYGHRVKVMTRMVVTLIIETVIFGVLTAFVKIDTDSYQGAFFGIALLCSGVLTAGAAVNILSSTLLYPKFPHNYMKTCMMGEGTGGILGDIINIVSVSIYEDVNDAAFLYFLTGTLIVALTLIDLLIVSRQEFFVYCVATFPENIKKKKTSNKEIKTAFKKIVPSIILLLIFSFSQGATHPAVTSLVVSESDKSGDWGKKFFGPVITFFLANLAQLFGRFISSYLPWRIPEWILCIYGAVNSLLFVPAIWFCNAKPRTHLSVLFSHDWQYALFVGLFMLGNGYLFNMAITNIPRKTTKEESEVAFNIFNLFVGVVQILSSPIGLLVVKIL